MASPTFATLPREIRDRIYDFVWDLGQAVASSRLSSMHMLRSMRSSLPFDSIPFDLILALLRVNHQISAEAASTFYGKRKFYSFPDRLIYFLELIPLHRHLIKDIEVLGYLGLQTRFPPQTFDCLQNLNGLRSLTVRFNGVFSHHLQQHLVEAGIHRLTERIVVTVHSEYGIFLKITEKGSSRITEEQECVQLTDTLTCAKGENEWKSQCLHCRVIHRIDREGTEWRSVDEPTQTCDHDHHHRERYIPTAF